MLDSPTLARLQRTAENVIWFTHHRAPKNSKARVHEHHHVAALLRDGPGQLAAEWKPILAPHGLTVRIGGAFCHGSPQVEWDNCQVELADLMIITRIEQRHGHWKERASLIQAKMSDQGQLDLGSHSSKKKNYEQLLLLTNWPPFTFVARAYDSATRLIADLKGGQAGYYATISKKQCYPEDLRVWIGGCPWLVPSSNQGAWPSRSLGHLIVSMLDGKDGKELINREKSDPSTWSGTVRELLDRLVVQRLKSGPVKGPSRVQEVVMSYGGQKPMAFGKLDEVDRDGDVGRSGDSNRGEGGDVPGAEELPQEESPGVPILLIEISAGE